MALWTAFLSTARAGAATRATRPRARRANRSRSVMGRSSLGGDGERGRRKPRREQDNTTECRLASDFLQTEKTGAQAGPDRPRREGGRARPVLTGFSAL